MSTVETRKIGDYDESEVARYLEHFEDKAHIPAPHAENLNAVDHTWYRMPGLFMDIGADERLNSDQMEALVRLALGKHYREFEAHQRLHEASQNGMGV